ncbi:MAG: ABC transporter ATP-binding protein [Acetatifactor sp.]|nr:ABC transporter ATP-binding protein [Acetatifactor sp.]
MNHFQLFIRSMKVMGRRLPVYLFAIFMMSVTSSLFSVMKSLLMKSVVDIAQTGAYQTLAATILVIVAVGVASLLCYRLATIAYNVEAKRVYGVLAESVLETEMRLPYTYYEKHHSGEIISKVSYDLNGMGAIYGSRFRRVIMPFLQVVVYLIPMFFLSWHLTLCLVAVNLVMLGGNMLLVKPMHKVSKDLSQCNSRMTSRLSDLLQGMEQVRMYRAGKGILKDFMKENKSYAKKYKGKTILTACLESMDRGFELLCSLFFLMLGIYFVNRGYTTLGALTAIYTMYGSFTYQFLMMGQYMPELVGCLANAQNIFSFLDEEREPENWYTKRADRADIRILPEKEKSVAISVENVTYSYSEDTEVLKDFSLQVEKGECVAITGPSGCGKTTLSKLLLGLYPIETGDLQLNGIRMRERPLAELRRQISYVPQEPYLFQGTIGENILLGNPSATKEDMMQAAKLANAHDFIMEFPNGYDTIVGERGNNMSGGQRQRIAIARAILKNAPILLLDEATSALDNESEQLVNDAMRKLQGRQTILMIAHRPSTIQLADKVVRM